MYCCTIRMANSLLTLNNFRLLFTPVIEPNKLLKSLESRAKGLNNYNTQFHGTKAHWVVEAQNRTPGDPVFVYFHGGGYCLPLLDTHIKFLIQLYKTLNDSRFSILVVDYSLAPEKPYPTQLIEAATVYQELVDKDHARKIILSGDSAGGNLAVVLSAHLKHHHPEAPLPETYVQPFAEVLISPWIKIFPELEGSYLENSDADILGLGAREWANAYISNDEKLLEVPWVSPLDSKPEFWEGVFPKNTLITCGENEVMKDDVLRFKQLVKIPRLHYELDGSHNSLFLDRNLKNHALLLEIVHYIREILGTGPPQSVLAAKESHNAHATKL
ncbi:Say1p [Sugiyamaella lignohabitans]|uniref:Say1p n=1 Tax=Sugiyamaella lignohabitans TaxID=796027 RepID=A0A161HMW5_9ASCO|nr:Say1p [Sugiyamaella lignohabitans]ANB15317.1 Say1p [Sugiyamaella lignohabitans]